MIEFLTLAGFVTVNLIGMGFFFGSLCQQLKDLDEKVKTMSNHLSEIQGTLTDIKVKTMNMNSRLINLERRNNAGEDEE